MMTELEEREEFFCLGDACLGKASVCVCLGVACAGYLGIGLEPCALGT